MPGPRGAPLLENELPLIEKYAPSAQRFIPADHKDYLRRHGAVQGVPGDYTTQVIRNSACVFVYYEEGIAKCSFEKAFMQGGTDWIKPLSCHLFPIRIDRGFEQSLRYEAIAECAPALRRGVLEEVELISFLKPSLMRAFGAAGYRRIQQFCKDEKSTNHPESE